MLSSSTQSMDTNTLSLEHANSGALFKPESSAYVTSVVAGLFTQQDGGYAFYSFLGWDAFSSKCNELGHDGYTLVSVDTYQMSPTETYFTGCWLAINGANWCWRTSDWSEFMAKHNEFSATTRLLDFDIHYDEGTLFYLGAWGSTPAPQTFVVDQNWSDFEAQWKQLSSQGKRLSKVQAFESSGEMRLTGIYEQGNDGYALYVINDWNNFYATYQTYAGTQQLVDFQVYGTDSMRRYIGVWRQTQSAHQFIFGLDWGSFVNRWQTLSSQGYRLQKAIRYSNAGEALEPQWDSYYQQNLAPTVEGYSYYVFRNGTLMSSGGVNHARTATDAPAEGWSIDTRINLASVSKSITAVAVLKVLRDHGISVDQAFYPFVQAQFPQVGPNVDKVTIRNLLEMKSGMVADGTLWFSSGYWQFLSNYLAQQNVPSGAPGTVYAYSNTNFTILQALIDTILGHGGQTQSYYPTYVNENVLTPMGVNLSIFNTTPDPHSSSVLGYNGASDTGAGYYPGAIDAVAAGGWVSSAPELMKFLQGVRNNTVLSDADTRLMFEGQLGWYIYNGIYGEYYHHNGGLTSSTGQGLKTGIIHLTDGYDALILINDWHPDSIQVMINAFESRN